MRCFRFGSSPRTKYANLLVRHNLPVAEKPESQQLCFLQGEPQGTFIQKHIPNLSLKEDGGSEGKAVENTRGIHYFTVGQRRGLGVAVGKPQYVVAIDPDRKEVQIGSNEDLMKRS